jgi:LysR family hca operon transcriptional activator
MERNVELRHLRYFIAVAEEGSLTVAAERRLHTAQPSLSRQIRDLEREVAAELFARSVRGVELTAAGHAFLAHARRAVAEAEEAVKAARREANEAKPAFAIGFLTGQEVEFLPPAMRVLSDQLLRVDVTVSSDYSPRLAESLVRGTLDLAFMRREAGLPELDYKVAKTERLVVVLPSDHRLASQAAIAPHQLSGASFLGMSSTAPALQVVIDAFVARCGLRFQSIHRVDNLAMALSLVASTRSVVLLPEYADYFLPWSVTSRPLTGDVPTIEVVVGYRRANTTPTLALFLERFDDVLARRKEAESVRSSGV